MNTAKEQDRNDTQVAQIASLEQKIKTLTEETAAALVLIQQLHIDLHRSTEDRQNENQVFQKTIADLTMTIAVLEKALDSHSSPTPSTRTSWTWTPPITCPPTSPPEAPYMANLRATGALHPFSVTHFDTDLQYSPQDSHECEPTTQTYSPKPSSPTSQTSTSTSARISSPPGHSRVPQEIVHLLDGAMAGLGDLDLDCLHDIVSDAMDEIYKETPHFEFWDDKDGDLELDRLLKTRHSQLFLKQGLTLFECAGVLSHSN